MTLKKGYKYDVDINYFKKIDNNAAYILGFISADGNVNENYSLRISLQKRDREILDFIKKTKKHTPNKIIKRKKSI